MKEITAEELKQLKDSGREFQLIDVRENYEYDAVNLGGLNIPMSEIPEAVDSIRRDVQVVIHCRSGSRSAAVIHQLESAYGFDNLYNLKGGIRSWADQVDTSMPKF